MLTSELSPWPTFVVLLLLLLFSPQPPSPGPRTQGLGHASEHSATEQSQLQTGTPSFKMRRLRLPSFLGSRWKAAALWGSASPHHTDDCRNSPPGQHPQRMVSFAPAVPCPDNSL